MKTDKFTLDLERPWGACPRCGCYRGHGVAVASVRHGRAVVRPAGRRYERPLRPIRVKTIERYRRRTGWSTGQLGLTIALYDPTHGCPDCKLYREYEASRSAARRRESDAHWNELDPPEGPPVPKPVGVARARREVAEQRARARELKHRTRRGKDRR